MLQAPAGSGLDTRHRRASQLGVPGKDLPKLETAVAGEARPAQPRVQQAVGIGIPQGMFAGAASLHGAPKVEPPAPNTPSAAPAGFDPAKWNDPAKQSPKYLVGRSIAGVRDQILGIQDEAGRKGFVENHLKTLIPEIQKQGWTVHEVKGEKLRISGGPNNEPPHWADAVGDIEGQATVGWSTDLPGASAPPAPLAGAMNFLGGAAQPAPTALGADYGALRNRIMQALQVNPQLAALGQTYR